ncbi:MAG: sigma-54-dependent Fis family transcriptional regulator, partial [Fibrobacteres bacterium]|nr:sigma-54-dependent Fis family transcriptional regulator [Fibrobacterota bacterium]
MEDYEAYRLQDVTDFQQRVKNLENQYRTSLEKERNLERIVTRIRQQTGDFVGSGKTITALREMALRIAPSKATVLIQGETGTGKEVLAHYVHNNSAFRKGPFVKVDCATITSTLMESILFGHEKGAFTGATGSSKGLFEQASEGTLFLDEVNNLTLETQAKLLRFLNDQTIVRLGGQNPIHLNLRIIAASNRSLLKLVEKGLFRQDLYYRLAVAELFIPPLREQLENMAELCNHFLQNYCRMNGRHIKGFSTQALKKFFSHSWPGNVRELRNIVERAVLFCQGDTITDDLVDINSHGAKIGESDIKVRKPSDFTQEEFTEMAKKHGGVLQRVAEEFGISRRALYYQLAKFGIDANSFRKNPRRRS